MNKIKILALIITSITLTACVNDESGKLDNRVKAYWDAKVKKDFKTAYTFLTPGWKKTETVKEYENRMSIGRVKWQDIVLKSKKCEKPDFCKVTINIAFSYKFSGVAGDIVADKDVSENWLLKNNVWYNLPKKR